MFDEKAQPKTREEKPVGNRASHNQKRKPVGDRAQPTIRKEKPGAGHRAQPRGRHQTLSAGTECGRLHMRQVFYRKPSAMIPVWVCRRICVAVPYLVVLFAALVTEQVAREIAEVFCIRARRLVMSKSVAEEC